MPGTGPTPTSVSAYTDQVTSQPRPYLSVCRRGASSRRIFTSWSMSPGCTMARAWLECASVRTSVASRALMLPAGAKNVGVLTRSDDGVRKAQNTQSSAYVSVDPRVGSVSAPPPPPPPPPPSSCRSSTSTSAHSRSTVQAGRRRGGLGSMASRVSRARAAKATAPKQTDAGWAACCASAPQSSAKRVDGDSDEPPILCSAPLCKNTCTRRERGERGERDDCFE